ncbi:MAG: ABC transporter permease [Blastocatellia bacterium]|nr:ABC transporter permease [Blastocatellia bacterium]
MDNLFQDLRYGARMLLRSPGFTFVAIFTLALGIGANTAIFSVVNAFLLRPLPFDKPEEIVHIWQTDRQQSWQELRVSIPNFNDWRDQNDVFQDLGGYYYRDYNVTTDEEPVRAQIGHVTPNMLSILNVKPVLGRSFLPEEGTAGKERVVVLGHNYWQQRFASNPNVLGETVTLDGNPHMVIGVMPPEFVFPLKATQMWAPLVLDLGNDNRKQAGPLLVVGRLKPGVSIEKAQAEMSAIAQRLEQAYPADNAGRGANIVPLRKALVFFYDMIRLAFMTLLLAVIFVLLIVCANVGNLMLARALGRTKEVAIRAALGAGRMRLIRQFLTEGMLLAAVGGSLGVLLAFWAVGLLETTIPEDLYRVGHISVDGMVLAFTLGLSLVSVLFFGLAPALHITRPSLNESLKEGDRRATGDRRAGRLRSLLVVSEIALALVLLVGSVLMVRSFIRLQEVKLGFNPENLLTMELILPKSKYASDTETNLFYQEALQRIESLPEVETAAAVYPLPLNFESITQNFSIEGRAPAIPGEKNFANSFWVTANYFDAMRIPVLRGRAFTDQDNDEAQNAVVINQKMVERFWPDEDPIGKQINVETDDGKGYAVTVIGVVGNSKQFLLNEEATSQIYLPQLQDSTRRRFLVTRTRGNPLSLSAAVRDRVWDVDEGLPITAVRSMDEVVSQAMAMWSMPAALLAGLGAGALLLAAMGIYGMLSYSVNQRTHEIGIRMALGAEKRDILKLVIGQGMVLMLTGLGVGLVATFALTRLMSSLLFGVSSTDALTFVGVSALLMLVALLACYLPARRATKVDPMVALRHE